MPFRRKSLLPVAAMLWIFPISPSFAELPLKAYQTVDVDSDAAVKNYVVGVGRGVFWDEMVQASQGRQKLFCVPNNLNLDEGIILSLLDQEIRSPKSGTQWDPSTPIELIMVTAFADRFPCQP